MRDERITNTFLGREYGWDRVSDVDVAMLRHNRECDMNVLNNPDKFPKADFDYIARRVEATDEFLTRYVALIGQFA